MLQEIHTMKPAFVPRNGEGKKKKKEGLVEPSGLHRYKTEPKEKKTLVREEIIIVFGEQIHGLWYSVPKGETD